MLLIPKPQKIRKFHCKVFFLISFSRAYNERHLSERKKKGQGEGEERTPQIDPKVI